MGEPLVFLLFADSVIARVVSSACQIELSSPVPAKGYRACLDPLASPTEAIMKPSLIASEPALFGKHFSLVSIYRNLLVLPVFQTAFAGMEQI